MIKAEFEQLAIAQDSLQNPVLFNYIPNDGRLIQYANPPRLMLLDEKCGRVYNTGTLELISEFKKKDDETIRIFNDSGYLVFSGNFFTNVKKPVFYGFNGKKIWQAKYQFRMDVRPLNTIICSKPNNKEHIAYDLNTGDELWRATILNKYHDFSCGSLWSIEHPQYIYLIADSLVRLDVRRGETFSRKFRVHGDESFFSNVAFVPALKSANKSIENENYFSGGISRVLTGMHSNWIEKGDSLIIADADSIYCFNRNLDTIWATGLPDGKGSKSTIRISGNTIYMLNFGIAFENGKMVNNGEPFASKFAVSDGRQLSVTFPKVEWMVTDGLYTDDGMIYLQTVKGLVSCLEGGDIPEKIKWNVRSDFEPDNNYSDFVLLDSVFVLNNGILEPVISDREKLVVEIYGKDVNVIRQDGECRFLSAADVYFHDLNSVYSTNEGRDKRNHFVIVDPVTKKVIYTIYLKGVVFQDKDNNIVVGMPSGVGILPRDKSPEKAL